MTISIKRIIVWASLLVMLIVCTAIIFYIYSAFSEADRRLEELRNSTPSTEFSLKNVSTTHFNFVPSGKPGWRYLTSHNDIRALVSANGGLLAASSGGLVKVSFAGELLQIQDHLLGLPDNELLSLVEYNGKIFAGSSRGLCVFRNQSGTFYEFPDIAVTSLLVTDNGVLAGTRGAGVIRFIDDKPDEEINNIEGADFTFVTSLAIWKDRIVVGTENAGVFLQDGTHFIHITSEQGLPANAVTDLCVNDTLLVSTLHGVCLIDNNLTVLPFAREYMASSVYADSNVTLIGTFDGTIHEFRGGKRRTSLRLGSKTDPVTIHDLVDIDGECFVLTSNGIFRYSNAEVTAFYQDETGLADSHIAALANDANGNIWVGTFDSGIDIRDVDLSRISVFQEPWARTIKCLVFDSVNSNMLVGSSKGLTRVSSNGKLNTWTKKEGLIADEVNAILVLPEGELIAGTGGGLSILSREGIKSVYAFHGLVNNKVFAISALDSTYSDSDRFQYAVGTLGGISLMRGSTVEDNVTPSNSDLPVHWISAMQPLDNGVLIGTYGGGICYRDRDGTWQEMPEALKNLEINPNAIHDTGDLVLVGTLDKGVIIYNKSTAKWRSLTNGLATLNITAFSSDQDYIYIGSVNGLHVVEKGAIQ